MKCAGQMLKLVQDVVTLNDENLKEEINNAEDQLLHKKFKNDTLRRKTKDRLKRLRIRLKETDMKIAELAKLHLRVATRSNKLITKCDENIEKICKRTFENLDKLNEENSKTIYTLLNTELQKRRNLKIEYLSNYVWRPEDSDFYTSYRVRTDKFEDFIEEHQLDSISDKFLYKLSKDNFAKINFYYLYFNDLKHYIESKSTLNDNQYIIVLKEFIGAWKEIKENTEFIYEDTLNNLFKGE